MRHFSPARSPSDRCTTRHGGATALFFAAVLASGLVLAGVGPCLAGSGIRGHVQLPSTAQAKTGNGARIREMLDPHDTVIYVTEAPGENGRKLSGRAKGEDILL